MQPVNGKRCGKPARYALAIEFHFFHEEKESYEGLGWFTCGDHRYDMTVTFQLRELDRE